VFDDVLEEAVFGVGGFVGVFGVGVGWWVWCVGLGVAAGVHVVV
jgi:hypothetical protein